MKKYRVICIAGLRGSLFLGRGEIKKGGRELAAIEEAEEEDGRRSWLAGNAGAEAGRMYLNTNSVTPEGFLTYGDENPENSVPAELTQALSVALQNNTLEDYMADISAEYVLLQADEVMQYIREDTSGVLESFYYDYIEGGEEWFLFERDNDIIVRQKFDNEDYPYRYYKFPCKGDVYGMSIYAYGKNEDYFFISWEDDDYLVVTKRAEGQVKGIAVYNMFGYSLRGWILGLEKQPDGEMEVTYYAYVSNGSGIQGEMFLDY